MKLKEPAVKYIFIMQEAYLEMERKATEKQEYDKAEVFAMSGVSLQHNYIASNLSKHILPVLNGKNCNMFGSDLRIHILENMLCIYPDISNICGKSELTDALLKDTVVNPSVIIEILSATTKE